MKNGNPENKIGWIPAQKTAGMTNSNNIPPPVTEGLHALRNPLEIN
jgi:hypothetical protein